MEPPSKRLRFGPAPFDDFDDPEADELNERPEDVNARRDPAVQLERSRAFAAFKLKSAFERIFEKYEKDFTGVGDEIKLSTGEIVVDNGHIQSLKDAQLGGVNDEDGVSGDEGSEAGSLNGEDRLMRGKADNRLSSLGQNPLALMPRQLGAPPAPFFSGQWLGPAPRFGGTPGLSSMMDPGQMPLGGFPMQYATPTPTPTMDPTWKAPELPSPSIRNSLTWKEATGTVRQKKARLSLSVAREPDGADEDDILLKDPSAGGDREGKDHGLVVKQRVLLPRPPPEKSSVKKKAKKPGGTATKPAQGAKELFKPQHAEKRPVESKKGSTGNSTAAPNRTPNGSSPGSNPDSNTTVEMEGTPAAETPMQPGGLTVPSTHPTDAGGNRSTQEDSPGESEPVAVESPQAVLPAPDPYIPNPTDPDVYIKLSGEGEEEDLTRKPVNQILRVEILAGNLPNAQSFRILTPEPGEADPPQPGHNAADELSPKESAAAVDVQDTDRLIPDKNEVSEWRQQAQAVPAEVFSRNLVDPAYAFSNEDEPTILKRRQSQRKQNSTESIKPVNAEGAVLREISQNIGSGMVSGEGEPVTDAQRQKVAESAVVRDPSPTLSLRLDDIEVSPRSQHSRPFGGVRDTPRREAITETSEQTNDKFEQMAKRDAGNRMPADQAESPSTRPPGSESRMNIPGTRSLKKPGRGRPRKRQLQETPVRTPCRPEIRRRNPPAQQTRQEIPETSPNVQPAISSPSASVQMSPILEIGHSDPPISPEELVQAALDRLNRAPSPTLTDPTSKPQTSPSLPEPPQPSFAPRTPVKTPKRRCPKTATKPTASTTTGAGTTKREGILSLLPADKDDDEEDELSIISPFRPDSGPGTTAIRSTPAGHHVRLGLLAPRSGGGRSPTSTASKLKRAVLAGSAAAAGKKGAPPANGGDGRFRTPSGRKGKGHGTPGSRLEEEQLVQTPGGTMRRCGEGGFRCEREFCFSCL